MCAPYNHTCMRVCAPYNHTCMRVCAPHARRELTALGLAWRLVQLPEMLNVQSTNIMTSASALDLLRTCEWRDVP